MQVSTSNPTTTEPLPADIVQSLASSPATGLPEQIDFYEAAITADETEPANYWHLEKMMLKRLGLSRWQVRIRRKSIF
jgi:DNA polymerase III psi subunit